MSASAALLQRWHSGDETALGELLAAHLPWLRRFASRRLSHVLRRIESSEDLVQTAVTNFLRLGPSFLPETETQFRALLARVVQNRLHDLHDYATAGKRAQGPGETIGSSISRIGCARQSEAPDEMAARNERRGFVALALELIAVADRQILHMREWEGMELASIGARLGISADAARMRCNAAVARLSEQVLKLQRGMLQDLEQDLLTSEAEPE